MNVNVHTSRDGRLTGTDTAARTFLMHTMKVFIVKLNALICIVLCSYSDKAEQMKKKKSSLLLDVQQYHLIPSKVCTVLFIVIHYAFMHPHTLTSSVFIMDYMFVKDSIYFINLIFSSSVTTAEKTALCVHVCNIIFVLCLHSKTLLNAKNMELLSHTASDILYSSLFSCIPT